MAFALSTAAEIENTQQPSQTASVPGLFNVVLLVIICVAVIAAAYFVTRFMARRVGGNGKSRHMQVLDRLSISNDKQIMMVKAGDKVYVLGVTGQSINHIATMDEQEQLADEPEATGTNIMGDFAQRFKASLPFGNNAKADKPRDNNKPGVNASFHNRLKQAAEHQDKHDVAETQPEKPIKSGLDTLDDMVSRRKRRFKADGQPDAAEQENNQADEAGDIEEQQTQDGETL